MDTLEYWESAYIWGGEITTKEMVKHWHRLHKGYGDWKVYCRYWSPMFTHLGPFRTRAQARAIVKSLRAYPRNSYKVTSPQSDWIDLPKMMQWYRKGHNDYRA